MDEVAVKGLHRMEVRDSNGDPDESRSRDQVSQDPRPAADRKAETLSRADPDGDPWRGARGAKEQNWKLNTDLACCLAHGRH
jgi:hypothetical protein